MIRIHCTVGTMFSLMGALGCSGHDSEAEAPAAAPGVYSASLTVPTPDKLPNCTKALAGTTAYVESPVGLWACAAKNWSAIPCSKATGGAVAYASASDTLLACVGGHWTEVAQKSGPTGPAGSPGAAGTLLSASPEPKGAHCANGGQRLDVGADANGNQTLDTDEVATTSYVCNGADGADAINSDLVCNGDTYEQFLPRLNGCQLAGVRLSGYFTGVDFSGADLSGAAVIGSLQRANLSDANLTDLRLSKANLGNLVGTCPASMPNRFWTCSAKDGRVALIASGMFLVGADFHGLDLAGADLGNARLSDVNLAGAHLEGARFEGAYLERLQFLAANLNGANLYGVDAFQTDFLFAELVNANLLAAFCRECTFEGANLAGARVSGDFYDVDFSFTNLAGVDLKSAHFDRVKATNLKACPASLPRDTTCELLGLSNLSMLGPGSSFARAHLIGADLSGRDLSEVSLNGASTAHLVGDCPSALPWHWSCVQLPAGGVTLLGEQADLAGADLSNLSLTDLELSYATLRDVNLTNTSVQTGYFSGADLRRANLRGAQLTNVAFYDANLTDADFEGAVLTDIYYSNTTCPDGTNSDDNGGHC